jgi:hypothetical protein
MLQLIGYFIKPLMKAQFENTRQNELDRFISSKNPTTSAEVDYWAKEYDRRTQNQGWPL